MFSTYLKVSVRNLANNKLFSAINIAGLSVGLSAVLLITLYIWDEITFDSYLGANPGIVKLEHESNFPGRGQRTNSVTPGAPANGLLSEYPDLVAGAARIMRNTRTVTVEDRSVSETVYFADASFFTLFDVAAVAGDLKSALADQTSMAISARTAQKYFPAAGDNGTDGSAAIGQTLLLDNGTSYRVSAVYQDFPENTHIRPDFMFPMFTGNHDLVSNDAGWWQFGFYTYLRLKDGVTPDQLRAILPEFIDRHMEAPSADEPMSNQYGFKVIPLADIHFETAAAGAGDPLMLTGFAAIAFVILSIATFNFMNMSLSRTVGRVREVAVRKVFGAGQKNIISLFLNETLLTVIISLFLAVVITELSLVWFNDFVSKLMSLGTLITPEFIAGLVGLVLVVSLGAGLYPAKVVAGLRPATVLRGGRSASKSVTRLGTILVTAQFAVAIGLMIAATIIYQQISYSQSMDPGYKKENMLLLRGLNHRSVQANLETLKDRIGALPEVSSVALVDQAPGGRFGWMDGIDNVNGEPLPQGIAIRGVNVGDDFLPTFGMELVAGRALSTSHAADVSVPRGQENARDQYNIMINEQALTTLGLGTAEEAIGKTLGQGGTRTIVGVIGDYLWGSSKGTVPAAIYVMDENTYRLLAVRFKTDDISALAGEIDSVWSDLMGARPIRRQFMDDRIAALYRFEAQQGELFALFAGLSVLVSCIGLYGLASFSVARRTKEIGVRKVLGASRTAVTGTILWDFAKPVLIANIIAWPVAGLMMRDWLMGFTYHIDLGPTPFVAAAALALVVAAVTVGGHALRVASDNPVHALRYE